MRVALKHVMFVPVLVGAIALAGCGLEVSAPDLFLLQRTGQDQSLTLLVKDDGTIRCDGGGSRQLPGQLLLDARDLASSLDPDAKAGLHLPSTANSIYSYRIKLQHGTISFPDTAARGHSELARTEQFVLQARGSCS